MDTSHLRLERRSSEAATVRLSWRSEHKQRAENLPFDIDVWYPSLAKFTFPTVTMPLRRREAEAVVRYYRLIRDMLTDRPFNAEDVAALESLEQRLAQVFRDNAALFGKNGAFLRMCGRSPKDADSLDRVGVYTQYLECLDKVRCRREPHADDAPGPAVTSESNCRLLAMARTNHVMRVRNAEEAMQMLLTSERVFTDFYDWLLHGEPEQIALRQFEPQLTLENEFRVFVFNGCIVAISQYDHYAIYTDLHLPVIDEIQDAIVALWKTIDPHVSEPSYAMDFAWLPLERRVVMIELSPYLRCTGTACFNWDRDAELLQGRLPVARPDTPTADLAVTGRRVRNGIELRMNIRLHPEISHLLDGNWDGRWKRRAIEHYRQVYRKFSPSPALAPAASNAGWLSWALGYLNLFSSTPPASPPRNHLLFVYGTLKSGFHWNSKYLSIGAELVGACGTVHPVPLLVGQSGVPYMLAETPLAAGEGEAPSVPKRVVGELWRVDDECLAGLDEYEGIEKGHYRRQPIEVQLSHDSTGTTVLAQVYVSALKPEALAGAGPFLACYTLDMHRERYRAIRHIQVKQQQYLGCNLVQS